MRYWSNDVSEYKSLYLHLLEVDEKKIQILLLFFPLKTSWGLQSDCVEI